MVLQQARHLPLDLRTETGLKLRAPWGPNRNRGGDGLPADAQWGLAIARNAFSARHAWQLGKLLDVGGSSPLSPTWGRPEKVGLVRKPKQPSLEGPVHWNFRGHQF